MTPDQYLQASAFAFLTALYGSLILMRHCAVRLEKPNTNRQRQVAEQNPMTWDGYTVIHEA